MPSSASAVSPIAIAANVGVAELHSGQQLTAVAQIDDRQNRHVGHAGTEQIADREIWSVRRGSGDVGEELGQRGRHRDEERPDEDPAETRVLSDLVTDARQAGARDHDHQDRRPEHDEEQGDGQSTHHGEPSVWPPSAIAGRAQGPHLSSAGASGDLTLNPGPGHLVAGTVNSCVSSDERPRRGRARGSGPERRGRERTARAVRSECAAQDAAGAVVGAGARPVAQLDRLHLVVRVGGRSGGVDLRGGARVAVRVDRGQVVVRIQPR